MRFLHLDSQRVASEERSWGRKGCHHVRVRVKGKIMIFKSFIQRFGATLSYDLTRCCFRTGFSLKQPRERGLLFQTASRWGFTSQINLQLPFVSRRFSSVFAWCLQSCADVGGGGGACVGMEEGVRVHVPTHVISQPRPRVPSASLVSSQYCRVLGKGTARAVSGLMIRAQFNRTDAKSSRIKASCRL